MAEMGAHEPSILEIWITLLVGHLLGGRFYRPYVEGLGLRGDERVLDFGTGAGTPARYLAARLPRAGGHLTCLDVSQRWQAVARRRLRRFDHVDFVLGDVRAASLEEASFDLVFIHFVLHEIPASERPGTVRRLSELLAGDGRLAIREPLNFISRDEIRRLMAASGLVEKAGRQTEVRTQGQVYEGVYTKA
jgi:ubiquinone/menaquinone biosynthesis C-methylase UbiE